MTRYAAIAAIALCFGYPARAQEAKAPIGNAAQGQALYKADGCWECHGTVGQGAGLSGPRLAPMEWPFEPFLLQLRNPQNNMPPFREPVLSDAEAASIYAFLKTIPEPPDVKSIAILNR